MFMRSRPNYVSAQEIYGVERKGAEEVVNEEIDDTGRCSFIF